jgi:hypothetical protein
LGETAQDVEAVCFSEMLVSAYKYTALQPPEDQHRHLYRREVLKSKDHVEEPAVSAIKLKAKCGFLNTVLLEASRITAM